MSQKVILENKSLDNIDISSQLSSFQSKIINIIYPVGAVYISTTSTSPQTLFGGSWESIGTGRCLMGADGSHAAGTTAEAGLPNITGVFQAHWNTGNQSCWKEANNAFYVSSGWSNTLYGTNATGDGIKFDASRSNSIYGNSSTVQPPAYYVYMWRRIR